MCLTPTYSRRPSAAADTDVRRQGDIMTVKRMDNVGIVVEDIDAAIEFFTELGLELEGRAPIEGDWADGVTGLRDMRVEIAMMGHDRELGRPSLASGGLNPLAGGLALVTAS